MRFLLKCSLLFCYKYASTYVGLFIELSGALENDIIACQSFSHISVQLFKNKITFPYDFSPVQWIFRLSSTKQKLGSQSRWRILVNICKFSANIKWKLYPQFYFVFCFRTNELSSKFDMYNNDIQCNSDIFARQQIIFY